MIYVIIALLAAAAIAYLGYVEGFRVMWPILFNVLVSVYVAVFLTRAVAKLAPGLGNYQYYKAIIMVVIAVIMYLLMYLLARFFAKDGYIHSLPELFESIGGAVLGFFIGLVCTGFVVFTLYTFVSKIKAMPEVVKTNIAVPAKTAVDKSCRVVGGMSLQTLKSNMGINGTTSWILGESFETEPDKNADKDESDEAISLDDEDLLDEVEETAEAVEDVNKV